MLLCSLPPPAKAGVEKLSKKNVGDKGLIFDGTLSDSIDDYGGPSFGLRKFSA